MKVRDWNALDRIKKSLEDKRVLRITYKRMSGGDVTTREIEPLCLYRGEYEDLMVMAFCRLRGEYRKFAVEGITDSLLKYEKYDPKNFISALAVFIVNLAQKKLGGVEGLSLTRILEKMVNDHDLLVVNL